MAITQNPKPAAKPAAAQPAQAKPGVRPVQAATAKPAPTRVASPAGVQTKTAVQTVAPAQLPTTGRDLDMPEHIKKGAQRGSENVELSDVVVPRIELVQALSKCLEEGDADYIPDARPGMLYNSVTRQLYGRSITVCPVFFKKQYLGWRDRKAGGGFCGAHDSLEECRTAIAEQEDPDKWEGVETAQQIVLVVDPETGECEEAVISMARTKLKVSRQWNALIRINGHDRFSRVYEIFGADEENNTGDAYKNFGFRYVGWSPVEVYRHAERLYNAIASGERTVKIDDTYEDISDPTANAQDVGGESGTGEY